MRRLALLFALAGCFALQGCFIPISAVAAPLRASFGTGGVIGPTNRPSDSPLVPLPFHFQLAVMPMQVVPHQYERRFDFGVGFQFYHDNRHITSSVFAPHVEGSFVLWREPLNQQPGVQKRFAPGHKGLSFGLTRVSLTWQVQVPITDTRARDVGFGATMRVTGEFLTFAYGNGRGTCSTSRGGIFCAAGSAWGEMSAGLYFEGTYMTLMGRHFGMISAGLTFRIPATAMVGFALVTP